jgi:membrane protein implicated in regulation of membrane protease activity
MIAAVALALLSLLVSWRVFRRTGKEAPEGSTQSIEASAGRT